MPAARCDRTVLSVGDPRQPLVARWCNPTSGHQRFRERYTMQCSEQRVIRIGTEFEVVGFDWEGNIRAREPMVTIEEATRWALANITSSGRVTFQACAAEALSEFVSGSVEDSTNA